jgi:hypothetical protein
VVKSNFVNKSYLISSDVTSKNIMSHMFSNQKEWNITMTFFIILTIGIIDMCTKI